MKIKFILYAAVWVLFTCALNKLNAATPPSLSYPANNAVGIGTKILFSWSFGGSNKYQYEVDTTNAFNSALLQTGIRPLGSTLLSNLLIGTRYYWRVRTIAGPGDTSSWTSTFNFTTITGWQVTSPANNATGQRISVNLSYKMTGCFVRLQYDTAADFSSAVLTDTLINDTLSYTSMNGFNNSSLLMRNLFFNKKYYVRAKLLSNGDSTAYSTTTVFTTLANPRMNGSFPATGEPVLYSFGVNTVSDISNDSQVLYQVEADTALTFDSPLRMSVTDIQFGNRQWLLHYAKSYYMRAKAWHPRDTSAWSVPVNFTTQKNPRILYPSKFDPDTFLRVDSVLFYVFDQREAKRFELMIDTTPAFNSPLLINDTMKRVSSGSGEKYIYNMLFNTRYYAKARLISDVDTSEWSDLSSYSTMSNVKLLAPVDQSTFQVTNPAFQWSSLKNMTGYTLQVDTSEQFNSPLLWVADSNKNVTQVASPDLLFDQVYYWRLKVRTASSESAWSVRRFSTSPYAIYISSPAENEANVAVSPTYISWEQPSAIRGFHYRISEDSLFNTITTERYFSTPVSSDNVMGLKYGTKYFLQVRGINRADTTDWYYLRRFFTKPLPVVSAAPALLTPANGAVKQNYSSTALTWTSVANAASYEIQTSLDAAFSNPVNGTSATMQIAVTGLQPLTKYYWRVRGVNETVQGPWSATFNFTTIALLNPPANLNPDNFMISSPTLTTLTWDANPNAESYQYQYANDPFFAGVATKSVTVNHVDLTNLQPSLTYYWRVRTVINPFMSGWSDNAIFRTSVTGLAEQWLDVNRQAFYPNPANDVLYLVQGLEADQVRCYDLKGMLLLESVPVNATIDLSSLNNGLCLIQLFTKDGMIIRKVMVNR